jgi:type I restriction enzyme R subunit
VVHIGRKLVAHPPENGRYIPGRELTLDIISHFIAFETTGETIRKIAAAYHQYHATNKAIDTTLAATSTAGDRRCGVVWHTQGSGKSLTMAFYAGKLIQALNNRTIVVLTDRNDLDDQLFGVFSSCQELFRQTPVQAASSGHLRALLTVAAGGVVFTTIQKFLPEKKGDRYPLLSERENIVVIADEAHRSQYEFIDGFARHMRDALPHASFIGFTGTPIELSDANTRAVFGEYIDVYDISQAVEDHATVPIYYEARLAKIDLLEAEKPRIDPDFEEATEGEEVSKKEKFKSKWARLEAMVGTEKRIALVAKDIVEHFEARRGALEGKGMIVAMSRRIAVELYEEIIKLRPAWHDADNKKGFLKVVITGTASDPLNFQPHVRNKKQREAMASRMKNPDDELKLVIVRDMWLTGFDVPSLHTMYVDKPMKGHSLMQAIARVNRVYKDKPGGLIVDYLGLAQMLKEALASYTQAGSPPPTISQDEAVSILLEKYEIVKALFHGFDYAAFFTGSAVDRSRLLAAGADFILGLADGKSRYIHAVTALNSAFALAVPADEALHIRDEVVFFQAIKAGITKIVIGEGRGKTKDDYDQAIRQIVTNAITSKGVIDLYDAAGLTKPDISIFSDEFLEEVREMEQKNLAYEMLQKLLYDKIKTLTRRSVVKSRSFAKMLEESIRRYQNQTIGAAQVVAELIELAKQIKTETEKGNDLGLTAEEIAFYDALCENESAVKELEDEILKKIAQELTVMLRKNTTIDWTLKENVRAQIRVYIKRLLRKYNYPPDKQESATMIVLEQAEILFKDAYAFSG